MPARQGRGEKPTGLGNPGQSPAGG
jgi:hypothetical protein